MLMMILLGQHGHSCLGCRMMMIMMMTMTIMMMMMMIVLLGEGGQARSRALRKTHSWAPLSSPASTQGHHHHHHHQHVLVMHGQDYSCLHYHVQMWPAKKIGGHHDLKCSGQESWSSSLRGCPHIMSANFGGFQTSFPPSTSAFVIIWPTPLSNFSLTLPPLVIFCLPLHPPPAADVICEQPLRYENCKGWSSSS